jgi:hypothetical protein
MLWFLRYVPWCHHRCARHQQQSRNAGSALVRPANFSNQPLPGTNPPANIIVKNKLPSILLGYWQQGESLEGLSRG